MLHGIGRKPEGKRAPGRVKHVDTGMGPGFLWISHDFPIKQCAKKTLTRAPSGGVHLCHGQNMLQVAGAVYNPLKDHGRAARIVLTMAHMGLFKLEGMISLGAHQASHLGVAPVCSSTRLWKYPRCSKFQFHHTNPLPRFLERLPSM